MVAPNHDDDRDDPKMVIRDLLGARDDWLAAGEVYSGCTCPRCMVVRQIAGSLAAVYMAAAEALRGNTSPIATIAMVCKVVASLEAKK